MYAQQLVNAPQSCGTTQTSDKRQAVQRNVLAGVSSRKIPVECSRSFPVAPVLTAAAASALLLIAPASQAREPFLSSMGGRGLLAEEEANLLRLREQKEGEVKEEIERARRELESQAVASSKDGQLCVTPFGVDVVGITEFVALTGALVGGYSARQRKKEVELLNERLRKINFQLRQQARAGTLYAPGLTYAPPLPTSTATTPLRDSPEDVGNVGAVVLKEPMVVPSGPALFSMEEEDTSADAKACLQALKDGKRFLKEGNGASAMIRFEKALMLGKCLKNKVQERRAVRGLAAAARLTGQHRAAIKQLERVLQISQEIGDNVGDADAYGTIADIYTDIGEFEKAAEYYDRYISKMNSDGSLV